MLKDMSIYTFISYGYGIMLNDNCSKPLTFIFNDKKCRIFAIPLIYNMGVFTETSPIGHSAMNFSNSVYCMGVTRPLTVLRFKMYRTFLFVFYALIIILNAHSELWRKMYLQFLFCQRQHLHNLANFFSPTFTPNKNK